MRTPLFIPLKSLSLSAFLFTHLPIKVGEITSLLLQKLVFSSCRDDIRIRLLASYLHIKSQIVSLTCDFSATVMIH